MRPCIERMRAGPVKAFLYVSLKNPEMLEKWLDGKGTAHRDEVLGFNQQCQTFVGGKAEEYKQSLEQLVAANRHAALEEFVQQNLLVECFLNSHLRVIEQAALDFLYYNCSKEVKINQEREKRKRDLASPNRESEHVAFVEQSITSHQHDRQFRDRKLRFLDTKLSDYKSAAKDSGKKTIETRKRLNEEAEKVMRAKKTRSSTACPNTKKDEQAESRGPVLKFEYLFVLIEFLELGKEYTLDNLLILSLCQELEVLSDKTRFGYLSRLYFHVLMHGLKPEEESGVLARLEANLVQEVATVDFFGVNADTEKKIQEKLHIRFFKLVACKNHCTNKLALNTVIQHYAEAWIAQINLANFKDKLNAESRAQLRKYCELLKQIINTDVTFLFDPSLRKLYDHLTKFLTELMALPLPAVTASAAPEAPPSSQELPPLEVDEKQRPVKRTRSGSQVLALKTLGLMRSHTSNNMGELQEVYKRGTKPSVVPFERPASRK